MRNKELHEVLKEHKRWLETDGDDGKRADLSNVYLSYADLRWETLRDANLRDTNLRKADLSGADLRKADLSGADLRGADGRYANLRGANLGEANLNGADLRGANIDYSVWPLWCGSHGVRVDLRIIYQLLAHVACLECDEPEFTEIKEKILPYARKSHRAEDLGLIEQ